MIWTLRKTFRFEAAHHLPHHDGKCRRVHGHSWEATVEVRSSLLMTEGPKTGMVVDYGDISAILDPIIEEYLDHHDLNATTGLESPTSENLAKWLFARIPIEGLHAVTVRETCTSECRYEREDDHGY